MKRKQKAELVNFHLLFRKNMATGISVKTPDKYNLNKNRGHNNTEFDSVFEGYCGDRSLLSTSS